MREPGEKPTALIADKAYLPLHCNGNGNPITVSDRLSGQRHAPLCLREIKVDEPFYIARWKTSPHLTVHTRACRDHFFGQLSIELRTKEDTDK